VLLSSSTQSSEGSDDKVTAAKKALVADEAMNAAALEETVSVHRKLKTRARRHR
jgi:hypothetical protein